MHIELSPSQNTPDQHKVPLYSAKFVRDTQQIAEIIDAPHDIATRWAEAMNELHGNEMIIKRVGVCRYCGSTRRQDAHCLDCSRVF